MHEVQVNHLVKLAHEKSEVRLTDRPDIAVDWDVKNQTKKTHKLTNDRSLCVSTILVVITGLNGYQWSIETTMFGSKICTFVILNYVPQPRGEWSVFLVGIVSASDLHSFLTVRY